MQRAVAVTPIGTSYVEHGVKETLVNIGKCLLVVSGDALTVTRLHKVRVSCGDCQQLILTILCATGIRYQSG
jgi:hypothetical protein